MVRSKEEIKEYHKKWRKRNREKINKIATNYYRKNVEKMRKKGREYYSKNKERLKPLHAKRKREYYKKNREEVIKHYAGNNLKCQNCGFNGGMDFLVIDHVNGGGRKERNKIGYNIMIKRIIKNNFPKEYNVICANCNNYKRINGKLPKGKSYYVGTAGTVTAETIRRYIQEQETKEKGNSSPEQVQGSPCQEDL